MCDLKKKPWNICVLFHSLTCCKVGDINIRFNFPRRRSIVQGEEETLSVTNATRFQSIIRVLACFQGWQLFCKLLCISFLSPYWLHRTL